MTGWLEEFEALGLVVRSSGPVLVGPPAKAGTLRRPAEAPHRLSPG